METGGHSQIVFVALIGHRSLTLQRLPDPYSVLISTSRNCLLLGLSSGSPGSKDGFKPGAGEPNFRARG